MGELLFTTTSLLMPIPCNCSMFIYRKLGGLRRRLSLQTLNRIHIRKAQELRRKFDTTNSKSSCLCDDLLSPCRFFPYMVDNLLSCIMF
jgi:hypothetical protein